MFCARKIPKNAQKQRTSCGAMCAPLAVGLSNYVLAGFDNRWGPFAAGSLIGAIPVVILFLFLQRYIVSGLTAGADKG